MSASTIKKLLKKAPYEPKLGIRLAQLTTTPVGNQIYSLVAIQLDKNKQLIPHLHEIDGEILYPLTSGVLRLGKALQNKNGEYQKDKEGKVLVKWDAPQKLIPGNPITILPKIPHHITAGKTSNCMVLFFLPQTHLNTDRKFVNYP